MHTTLLDVDLGVLEQALLEAWKKFQAIFEFMREQEMMQGDQIIFRGMNKRSLNDSGGLRWHVSGLDDPQYTEYGKRILAEFGPHLEKIWADLMKVTHGDLDKVRIVFQGMSLVYVPQIEIEGVVHGMNVRAALIVEPKGGLSFHRFDTRPQSRR